MKFEKCHVMWCPMAESLTAKVAFREEPFINRSKQTHRSKNTKVRRNRENYTKNTRVWQAGRNRVN